MKWFTILGVLLMMWSHEARAEEFQVDLSRIMASNHLQDSNIESILKEKKVIEKSLKESGVSINNGIYKTSSIDILKNLQHIKAFYAKASMSTPFMKMRLKITSGQALCVSDRLKTILPKLKVTDNEMVVAKLDNKYIKECILSSVISEKIAKMTRTELRKLFSSSGILENSAKEYNHNLEFINQLLEQGFYVVRGDETSLLEIREI